MNIANLYKTLKQILNDSNIALNNRGLNSASDLSGVATELASLGTVNRLPYVLQKKITTITQDDLQFVTTIGTWAFSDCTSLTSITIPDSVTRIGDDAFYGCTSLTNITIPDSVTTIGNSVFYGCKSLTDIRFYSVTPPALSNTLAIPKTTTIHVPIGSGDAYKSATNWSSIAGQIVEDIVIE